MDKPTKLNKTFTSGNVLYADELNLLTSKIDEIIDAFNNLPTGTPLIINNTTEDYSEEITFLKDVLGEIFTNYESSDYSFKAPKIIAAIRGSNGALTSEIKVSADNIIVDGNTTILGYLNATYAKLNLIETSHISVSNGQLTIGADAGCLQIYFDVSGNSDRNNVSVSISNDGGIEMICSESTSGETGSIRIGKEDNKFGIFTRHYSNGINVSPRLYEGYTGVVGGVRFVNGICVGPNLG